MNTAIYARRSTEQNGIADEARSVARQVEHARAYATRRGWTAAAEHVFSDDGISGALFGAGRPGLARLLAALAPRPPFTALVMSEESRLGRESIETGWTLKQIVDAGVRVFYYLTDQERTLDSATDKVMLSLSNFASEMERERARFRTHDALLRKAKAGAVCGGRLFGYINRPVSEGGRRSHVERVIDPREARVVKRIFTLAADGWGVKRIAAQLNDEAAASPMPRRAGRPRGWAPSSVREVLHRETYRGVVTWNRTARVVRQGARAQRRRPADDVVTVAVPELAIVDAALWTAAGERMRASAEVYRQRTGGRAFGRPANGVDSPYLLTGLGTCQRCGGSMQVLKRAHGSRGARRQVSFFGCMTRHTRGSAVCGNALEVRLADVDDAVLASVEHHLLRVEVLETALYRALESMREPADGEETQGAMLRAELAQVDAEAGRLASAIAAGGDIPALVAALQERERRRAALRGELAALDRKAATRRDDGGVVARALDVMRAAIAEWKATLRQEAPQARRALRSLVQGRFVFTPGDDGSYSFAAPGTIDKVIAGVVAACAKGGVAPTGFERLWDAEVRRIIRVA